MEEKDSFVIKNCENSVKKHWQLIFYFSKYKILQQSFGKRNSKVKIYDDSKVKIEKKTFCQT